MTRPVEQRPVLHKPLSSTAKANAKALKKMSLLERETGLTAADYEAFHAAQRERVRTRYVQEGQ